VITITEVEIVKQYPPDVWLRACTDYLPKQIKIESTGDLAKAIPPLVSAIEQCDLDKTALREWARTD